MESTQPNGPERHRWQCFRNSLYRRNIPQGLPGVYVAVEAVNGEGIVRYIGQSLDVGSRVRVSLQSIAPDGFIFVWPEPEGARRLLYECIAIRAYQPTFNQTGTSRQAKSRCRVRPLEIKDAGVWDWPNLAVMAQSCEYSNWLSQWMSAYETRNGIIENFKDLLIPSMPPKQWRK